jgi:O-succinylbenzoate synthase
MEIRWHKHRLDFTFEAGTSRGVLTYKDTWYLIGTDKDLTFYGECGPLRGLSIDDRPDFESKLDLLCAHLNSRSIAAWNTEGFIESLIPELNLYEFPSIIMGLETLHADYIHNGRKEIFKSNFYKYGTPILINGLIWMNQPDHMYQQAIQKIQLGHTCIKLKVGAIDFEKECQVLEKIREEYSESEVMLRLDANGAFGEKDVWEKLERLSEYDIHSIEQPVRQGQSELMRQLCKDSPIEVALDEELIGAYTTRQKETLLEELNPPFIILKPTLLGGFASTAEWIEMAEYRGIEWWITSALESNIGLNAICQFTSMYPLYLAQGLGTGSLYHNNIPSPLNVYSGMIHYDRTEEWDMSLIHTK